MTNTNHAAPSTSRLPPIPFSSCPASVPATAQAYGAGVGAAVLLFLLMAAFGDVLCGVLSAIVMLLVAAIALLEIHTAWQWRERLRHELIVAEHERWFRDPAAAHRYVAKHCLQLFLDRDAIRERFRSRVADQKWVAYLELYRDQGGAEVLASYSAEAELLVLAMEREPTLPWDSMRKIREEVEAIKLKALAEAEAEAQAEQLRAKVNGEQHQPFPWEARS